MKYKLGSSIIDQIGKTAFTAEFLTLAHTLVEIIGKLEVGLVVPAKFSVTQNVVGQ